MPGRGRPFQKGRSGNINGRPRGRLSLPKIRKLLGPHGKAIVDALLELLKDSDCAKSEAVKLGMAYLWGKPAEKPIDDHMPPGLRDVDSLSDEELEARMLNGKGDDA